MACDEPCGRKVQRGPCAVWIAREYPIRAVFAASDSLLVLYGLPVAFHESRFVDVIDDSVDDALRDAGDGFAAQLGEEGHRAFVVAGERGDLAARNADDGLLGGCRHQAVAVENGGEWHVDEHGVTVR